MPSRNVRAVSEDERLELLRGHIKVAAEIVETFLVAFEDDIKINSDEAIAMLDEAANRLRCAHLDTFDSTESEEDAYKFDALRGEKIVALVDPNHPDQGIN